VGRRWLVHHAEIVQIEGDNSYRLKEAKEEAAKKAKGTRRSAPPAIVTRAHTGRRGPPTSRRSSACTASCPTLPSAPRSSDRRLAAELERRVPLDLVRSAFVLGSGAHVPQSAPVSPRSPAAYLER